MYMNKTNSIIPFCHYFIYSREVKKGKRFYFLNNIFNVLTKNHQSPFKVFSIDTDTLVQSVITLLKRF